MGTAKSLSGDPSGKEELERALQLALETRSPHAASIANNLGVSVFEAGDMRREGELFVEAKSIAERFGDGSGARWARGQLATMDYIYGNWDEALHEFIAECEAGSPHYLEAQARGVRGNIRLARGDSEGALADLGRSLALAREAKDPQAMLPELGNSMLAFESLQFDDEARALALETLDVVKAHPDMAAIFLSSWLLRSHSSAGFEEELRELVEGAPPGKWKEIARATIDRDFSRAADLWLDSGSPTFEAFLRERAAEELIEAGHRAEGEAELQRALAFYRSVGATFYIQRGEQLLAKSA
jgi:tetratricopeptide (TPR) repeat protein